MSEFIIECEYDSDEGWIPGEHREEIVRCRDCVYFANDLYFGAFCRYFSAPLNDDYDGFCAWGERKVVGE